MTMEDGCIADRALEMKRIVDKRNEVKPMTTDNLIQDAEEYLDSFGGYNVSADRVIRSLITHAKGLEETAITLSIQKAHQKANREKAEKQRDNLREALEGLVLCISETRGSNADDALFKARQAIQEIDND